MQYSRISADCHLDLPWLPPDLFVSEARRELKDRMPYVEDGPDGPQWVAKNGATFGLRAASARSATSSSPARTTGSTRWRRPASTRTARRRGAAGRPAPAHQGDGPRRRRRRDHLRHSRRRLAAQRPRSVQRDAAHLQRLPEGFLQPLPRPPDRPRLPALWRHRGRRAGGLSGRQDGPQGPRTVVLLGHGADVAPDLGAAVEGGRRRAIAAAFPHLPGDAAERARRSLPGQCGARRSSPASPGSR